MNNRKPQKTVFLDRDGVINKCAPPHCYIARWEEFEFLPGVEEALRKLKEAGYLLIMVSNQRGIACGMLTQEQVRGLHTQLQAYLEQKKAALDGIYVCPHNIAECHCRKPDIGLFLQAEKDFAIDKNASWMVGDSPTDIEAGRKYGVKTILTTSLPMAAEQILGGEKAHEKSCDRHHSRCQNETVCYAVPDNEERR